jgi:drug/metabolite transporter (DMT)-like permease
MLVVWTTFHLVSRAVARDVLTPWDLALLRAAGGFLAVLPLLAARWRLNAVDAAMAFGLFVLPLYAPVWWLFLPSELAHASWQTIGFNLVFQGMVSGVLNGIIYTQCVRMLGAGTTSMVGAMVPSIAATLAWPLLGEALAPLGLAGVLLVTCATVAGVAFPGTARRN